MSAAIDPSLVQDQALHLLDHLPEAALVLDPETGTILFANQALGRLMDTDPEAIVGQPIAALDRGIGEDLDWGQSVQELRQKGQDTRQRTFQASDGRKIPVEVRARLVAIADTEVILATLIDVSETQRLSEDLGERVKELTLLHHVAELTHAWDGTPEALFQEVAEAIGPSWQYPDITEARISYADTVVATDRFHQGIAQIEASFETSDGTPLHVEVAYIEPRPPAHEGPFLAEEVALIRSVTAILRAHVEHRLQDREASETQRRFELAAEAASDVIWEWDAATDQLRWSDTYAARFGEDGDEVTTFEAWAQRVHLADRADVVAGIEAWLAGDQRTWSDTYRLRRADGTYAHIEDRGIVLRDEAGTPLRVVGALVDRSDEVEAEHERAFQASMLDQVGEAVIATDLQGEVRYWNRAAEETYGYARDEAIGQDINDLNVPEVTAEQAEEIMAALRADETWSGEVIVQDKDGREFPARVTDTPLHDADGQLVGIVGISTDISDQKALEQALRDSEARQRAWLEAAPDILATVEPGDVSLTWLNGAFRGLTGHDPTDWIGRPFTHLVHPEDLPRLIADYQTALGGGEPSATEVRIETADGSYRWFSILGRPVRRDGEVVDFFVVARDVTEHVEAEQALRESEQRFRELAETVDEIFWSVSADGELGYIGSGYKEVIGHPIDEELTFEQAMEAVHRDDREDVAAWVDGLLEGAEPSGLEYRIVDREGRPRWFSGHAYPVRDETGEILRVLGVGSDVHELVTARQALEESQAMFQSLVQNIEHVFWIVEADGQTVSYLSPAFERVFGVPWETLERPENWFDLIHPEDVEEVGRRFGQIFADAEAGEVTYRIVRPDGEVRWLRSLIRPDTAPDGSVGRFAGITQDITQEREAEAHREEALLRQAEAEHYQQVAEFKTQFLNTAAHELSTPLTPLKFQVEALRSGMMGDLSNQQRDAIEIIDRSVDRFSRLTRDLLDAARLQAGQLSLQRREIDLSDLIREVAEPFQEVADQAGVELIVDPDGPLPYPADADRLGQVLTNLVDNAIKFTPEGGTVTVQAVANGQGPVLRVLDTGIGMDPEQMARLFEPFTQVHDPDATKQRGTGLGLYISKGIVEQHGGSLEAASAGKTQGSTFTVHLPEQLPADEEVHL